DGIRDFHVTGVQTCALPIFRQYGWTPNTVKPGAKITLTGRRLKSGAPYINLTERARVVLDDSGKEIWKTANYGEPTPPPSEGGEIGRERSKAKERRLDGKQE